MLPILDHINQLGHILSAVRLGKPSRSFRLDLHVKRLLKYLSIEKANPGQLHIAGTPCQFSNDDQFPHEIADFFQRDHVGRPVVELGELRDDRQISRNGIPATCVSVEFAND